MLSDAYTREGVQYVHMSIGGRVYRSVGGGGWDSPVRLERTTA